MPTTTSPQVRQPIPNGSHHIGTCPVCGSADVTISVDRPLADVITCSQDPGPDGRHVIHPHQEWCPVLTGETPEVACLDCGAPVNEWDESRGVILTMPGAGPMGRDDHWLGNVDDPGYARNSAWASKCEPAPDFDRVTVKPCGHQHEGRRAHEMLLAIRTARAARANREADAEIAKHAELLAFVDGSEFSKVSDRYRTAVRSGSPEAPGILAVMRLMADAL